MLDLANKNQLNALSEMVLNFIKQNMPIQPETIQKLKRYKNVLQELRLRQMSLKRKREQLKKRVYLGVRACKFFHCFVAFVRFRVYYVDFFVVFVFRHW